MHHDDVVVERRGALILFGQKKLVGLPCCMIESDLLAHHRITFSVTLVDIKKGN